MLTALALVLAIANSFISDPPAQVSTTSEVPPGLAEDPQDVHDGLLSFAGLLKSPRSWILAVSANASVAGSIILTAHMVPMARSWGLSATEAATLLSVLSTIAMVGTVFFGWVADKVGGAMTLAILLIDGAVLWALLLHPPYTALLVIMGLIGFHAIGAGAALGMSMSEAFGVKNFSRAYGMANLVGLPFSVVAVPVAAVIYAQTNSYNGVILMEIAFLLIMLPMILSVRRKMRAVA